MCDVGRYIGILGEGGVGNAGKSSFGGLTAGEFAAVPVAGCLLLYVSVLSAEKLSRWAKVTEQNSYAGFEDLPQESWLFGMWKTEWDSELTVPVPDTWALAWRKNRRRARRVVTRGTILSSS